jgi:hypothetical protein
MVLGLLVLGRSQDEVVGFWLGLDVELTQVHARVDFWLLYEAALHDLVLWQVLLESLLFLSEVQLLRWHLGGDSFKVYAVEELVVHQVLDVLGAEAVFGVFSEDPLEQCLGLRTCIL